MSTANTTHIEGTPLPNSRLRVGDVLRVGASGLRTRRLRTGLSTLGVAIGIAAMVGVLGLSASSREELQTKIRALGTNLLEVQASAGFGRGASGGPSVAEQIEYVDGAAGGAGGFDFGGKPLPVDGLLGEKPGVFE